MPDFHSQVAAGRCAPRADHHRDRHGPGDVCPQRHRLARVRHVRQMGPVSDQARPGQPYPGAPSVTWRVTLVAPRSPAPPAQATWTLRDCVPLDQAAVLLRRVQNYAIKANLLFHNTPKTNNGYNSQASYIPCSLIVAWHLGCRNSHNYPLLGVTPNVASSSIDDMSSSIVFCDSITIPKPGCPC